MPADIRGSGVAGSTPLIFAIFPTSFNTGPKFSLTKFTYLIPLGSARRSCGGRQNIGRYSYGVCCRKKKIWGAGDFGDNDRTSTKHRILVVRLSYEVRPITGLFTGHLTSILRVSAKYPTDTRRCPYHCLFCVLSLLCTNALNVVHGVERSLYTPSDIRPVSGSSRPVAARCRKHNWI